MAHIRGRVLDVNATYPAFHDDKHHQAALMVECLGRPTPSPSVIISTVSAEAAGIEAKP